MIVFFVIAILTTALVTLAFIIEYNLRAIVFCAVAATSLAFGCIVYYALAPTNSHIEINSITDQFHHDNIINGIGYCVADRYEKKVFDVLTFNHKLQILPINECQELIKTIKVN